MIRNALLPLIALVIAGGFLTFVRRHHSPKPAPLEIKNVAVTQAATLPTTRKAPKSKYPTYMEIIHTGNPMVAATQPLDYPVDLPDAAHLVIHDPTFLDQSGNLWITRSDGEPTEKALAKAADFEDHIITDRPVFVHWWTGSKSSKWNAAIVARGNNNGFDLITKASRQHLADDRPFRWNTAYSINDKIVVTTDVGVSVFQIEPDIKAFYHAMPGVTATANPPQTMLDTRGIVAWSPWENGKPGSARVSRFVDGEWSDLPAADWPARPIQLAMLLDGSVLRLAAGGGDADDFPDQVHLSIGQLDPTNFDQKKLNELILKLGDPDPDARQSAFDELSRYGPAIAPILEKAEDNALPSARTWIKQLLRSKITPALGGLSIIDNRLNVVRRCSDGSILFYAPAGVQIPSEHDEPEVLTPAWLAMRPDGRLEHPLSDAMVKDQKPESCTLDVLREEWILSDQSGVSHFMGTNFEPLLAPVEKRFTQAVGIGTRHRWVFREPRADGDTLVIDPAVADPTPKLPTWVIAAPKGIAGWDKDNLPVIHRGEEQGNWELQADGWKSLDEKEKVITEKSAENPESPAALQRVAPATTPATKPSTTQSLKNPILVASDGALYYDGKTSLIRVAKDGATTEWPLPGAAAGTADPVLMQTSDGLLFLFNQGGRLLRIRSTPNDAEPFKLEATFTKDIPNTDHPGRVWVDPAGRIDFVSDDNILTVAFPAGTIPKEISRMILQQRP